MEGPLCLVRIKCGIKYFNAIICSSVLGSQVVKVPEGNLNSFIEILNESLKENV